jgi:hypothetical protein
MPALAPSSKSTKSTIESVRSFSTTSRPALRAAACGGRPRAGSQSAAKGQPTHWTFHWSDASPSGL